MSVIHRAVLNVLVCMVLPFAGITQAAEVENLYSVSVPVDDQSAGARADALKAAMEVIIVRLTGRAEVLQTGAANELLSSPARFLQQYSYESVETTAEVSTDRNPLDAESRRQLMLQTRFDGVALERRLRAAGLPVWGRERPDTLVLMAIDAPDTGRALVAADTQLATAWQEAVSRRGLPLELPAMDSEDRGRISVMDVWGVFDEPLWAAAERYDPHAVLAVSAWATGAEWVARATLLRTDEANRRWERQGGTLQAVIEMLVDDLTETYAAEFAVGTAGMSINQQVTLEIRDINDLASYARMLEYLAGLSAVESLGVARVEGDRLTLNLHLRASRDSLEKAIALGRLLEPVRSNEITVPLGDLGGLEFAPPQTLVYRYRR